MKNHLTPFGFGGGFVLGMIALLAAADEPRVVGITLTNNQAEVRIASPAYAQGQVLELYSFDGGGEALTGFDGKNRLWDLAESNLVLAAGVTNVVWTDSGQFGRRPPPAATNRYYAMGNARSDSDGDGLSDGLEAFVIKTLVLEEDTDGDGLNDGWEERYGFDPFSGLNSNLLAWWRFEEPSGTLVSNALGPNYQGSCVAMDGTNRVGGFAGQALWFDGTNDYVSVPQNPVLVNQQPFTISAYVKLDLDDPNRVYTVAADLVSCSGYYGGCALGLIYGLPLGLATTCGVDGGYATASEPLGGEWAHLAMSHDGTNIFVYVNGHLTASADSAFAPVSNAEFRIGHGVEDGALDWHFRGALDEVRVYNYSMPTGTVADLTVAFRDDDGDGLSNGQESQWGTNPFDDDTDGDGLSDLVEVENGLSPTVPDFDADDDELTNAEEATLGTYPLVRDSDADGVPDGPEVAAGCTSPLQTNSFSAFQLARIVGLPPVRVTVGSGFNPVFLGLDGTNGAVGNVADVTGSGLAPAGLTSLAPCTAGVSGAYGNGRLQYTALACEGRGTNAALLKVYLDHYDAARNVLAPGISASASFTSGVVTGTPVWHGPGNGDFHDCTLVSGPTVEGGGVSWTADFGYRAAQTGYTDGGWGMMEIPFLPSLPLVRVNSTSICPCGESADFTAESDMDLSGLTLWWTISPEQPDGPRFAGTTGVFMKAEGGATVRVHAGTRPGGYTISAAPKGVAQLAGGGALELLQVDIAQSNVFVCAGCTNNCGVTLTLTNSYADGGTIQWYGGPTNGWLGTGDSLSLNPSGWPPSNYTITARSSLISNCLDTCVVTVLKVDFNKDPVKVGIGANRTSETPTYPATTPATDPHRLIATITPKDVAGVVTFDSSNVGRATVVEVSRTDAGDTKQVILNVTGVAETPAGSPGGDTDIRALLNSASCKSTKAIVIKPTTRTHSVAGATIQNTSTLLPGGGTVLKSETFQIVTITIKDQFGNVLHAVYNGQDVVEEKFENVSNGGLVTTWTAINIPDRDLINGIKLDETGFEKSAAITATLTAAEQAAWAAGTLMISGANNTFKLTGFNFTTEGDMKLRVDGHAVSPDIHRKLEASAANHPPVPSTTTDTVIP